MNAARDLAETGTPGPWAIVKQHGSDTTGEGWSHIGVISPTGSVATTYPTEREHDDADADAAKIVVAVNALGPLGDLLDALASHRPLFTDGEVDFSITDGPNIVNQRHRCWCDGGSHEYPCPTARARDAVVAALRGAS